MQATETKVQCYHCGEDCDKTILFDDKPFCCDGCKMVYSLLNKSDLCAYYDFNKNPGANRKKEVRKNKFAFLDDKKIAGQIVTYSDSKQTNVTLYLPQVHCSSCLYLLENLHRINENIISSKVNFTAKEVSIVFSSGITLRKVAELLTSIGYEPYLSLNNLQNTKPKISKHLIYRLGVAGFCFGNIMLLSFPEYLGLQSDEQNLRTVFRFICLILSLPVVLYSAQPFYTSAFGALRNKFLNIDAPIVLAIFVTFGRSIYEIASGNGSGYFDSLSGIVFFMLAGRVLQDKTYSQLSFMRDYSAYFPVAVTVIKNDVETQVALPELKTGANLLIHYDELVPADGILTKGKAWIDYSFVTGESLPVVKDMGEIIYAGGKQLGSNIELLTIKEVSQSYLTSLWENNTETKAENKATSFVHLLSRYFTYIVFSIAIITAIYWLGNDKSKLWNAVTAILIIACPCALLLSNTFTNGNILAILGRNKFFLKTAQTIENIADVDYIIFDKTGTLTYATDQRVEYYGEKLSVRQQAAVVALASLSNHPLSRMIAKTFEKNTSTVVGNFAEIPSMGLTGVIHNRVYQLGSELMIKANRAVSFSNTTNVLLSEDERLLGCFAISNRYREHIGDMISKLSKKYKIIILSGDNENEKQNLKNLLGESIQMHFYQKPEDKLSYVKLLQNNGNTVMMVGDGLNDGPSLKQSDVGVAVSDGNNNFTPASDVITGADKLTSLYNVIRLCKANKQIVKVSFALSIIYNLVGIFFAVQGRLSPLIAAILMPASSLSIVLITYSASHLFAKKLKLY